MLVIKPKTRSTVHTYSVPEDFLGEILFAYPSFKRLTPHVRARLEKLIKEKPPEITSRSQLITYIKKHIFKLSAGSKTTEQYVTLLGWTEGEARDKGAADMSRALTALRKKYGSFTSFNKEYWVIRGLTENQAIQKVSDIQQANSCKIDGARKRSFLKNVRDSIHYENMNDGEAKMLISNHQREQSKRCIEYWVKRGHSEAEAVSQVTVYQCQQSKFQPEYWLKRGVSTADEARILASEATRQNFKNISGRSASSKKLFEALSLALPERKFIFGDIEHFISVKQPRRRGYFLDFYDAENKLNIEYDGEFWHTDPDADTRRDALLNEQGIKVLRISDKKKFEDAVNECLTFLGDV